jgi:hypothetical protein
MWAGSVERIEAASVAKTANDRLLSEGGAVASFPFCPALALQRTGDPLQVEESHRERATIAERVRLDSA